jgi:dUTP pyrophosphatase
MFKEIGEKLDSGLIKTKTKLEMTADALGVDKLIEGVKMPEFDFDKWYKEHTSANEPVNFGSVNFTNESSNPDPEYATEGASGFDIRAYIPDGEIVIPSGEYKVIGTGLSFELPEGFELQIRSRSGLAAKHGVAVLNGIGTIDQDYRGHVMVILINHGKNDFSVENGDRIAQGVFSTVPNRKYLTMTKVESLSNTKRGSGGLGSTGVK